MNETFFFDTYAIFEIIRGNPRYKPYMESRIILTFYNLAELNYNLKKEKDSLADEYTEKYSKFAIEVLLEDLKKAMDLKVLQSAHNGILQYRSSSTGGKATS